MNSSKNPVIKTICAAALVLLATACGAGVGAGGAGAGATDDSKGAELGVLTDVATDAVVPDVPVVPDVAVTPDVSPVDAGCTAPGCPCSENAQCDSSYCIETAAGSQCAKPCTANCDDGFKCIPGTGGDAVTICAPSRPRLCEPCAADSDCSNVLGGADSRCLPYKDVAGAVLGGFCGNKCLNNSDCSSGYSCKEATSVGGVKGSQCIKDDLTCACDARATKLALATACTNVNAAGSCAGKRTCGATGLGACDAQSALVEECNLKDDNCNGVTDEPSDGMCEDKLPCTYNNCVAGACQHPGLTGSCDDASACTKGDVCANGVCGGVAVVCDDKNPCTLDSCDATKGCTAAPDDTAKCSDDNVCSVEDACKGGVCLPGAATACDDSNLCTTDNCDPKNGCVFAANTLPCNDNDVCTLGDTCKGSACGNTGKLPCNDGNPCTDDTCDGAKGCVFTNNSAVCDDNNNCTIGDTCKDGTCTPAAPSPCDDKNPCTTETCDPKGGCKSENNTANCSDDNVCTVNDVCADAKCVSGKALVCNDGNSCTDDSCDAKAGCGFVNNLSACSDNNLCSENDSCKDGACQPGAPKNCDDNNLCTTDSCDPKKGCVSNNNNIACSDNNVCTDGDVCGNGLCNPGVAKICDDGNLCTTDLCDAAKGCIQVSNGDACSDGNVCTESDVCVGGKCQPGKGKLCDDGKPCTDDYCDAVKGCSTNNNSATCSDGDACTSLDVCKGGVCVGSGGPNCDDGNPCTDDSCDKLNACTHVANNNPCDDANVCTDGDVCKSTKCVPGAGKVCNDGKVCTDDSCDPIKGCVTSNNSAGCTDGDACTTNDGCDGGNCVGGAAPNCDDGNTCTNDSCDKGKGCLHVANNGGCNDGNVCTLIDVCVNSACTPGAAKPCDDGLICTTDSCDAVKGCQTANNTAPCTDGNVCTEADVCAGGNCVPGKAKLCDDGNLCTTDSCDKLTGCVINFNALACDDNNGCTSGDICNGGKCKGNVGCDANALCTPGAQTVSCVCKAGFTGNGFSCADVNECVLGNYTCPANEQCINTIGSYTCGCKVGFADCNNSANDGCEINTTNNTDSCNGCNLACSKVNNSPTCVNSVCTVGCNAGYSDCDVNPATGCEIKTLGTDVNNCGGCKTVCSASNISAACGNGVCNGACNGGYSDCDGNKLTNGCEVQTGGNDVKNCGGCQTVCSTNHVAQACGAGVCNGACVDGYGDCNGNKQSDGCEVNIKTNDLNNCGGCGVVCNGTCTNGVCAASYFPFGPQQNIAPATVTGGGWSLCYQDTYNVNMQAKVTAIKAACTKAKILMACKANSAGNFQLLAAGNWGDVFFDTGTGNTTHNANGVGWYFNANYSWGFTTAGNAVARGECDTVGGTDRLCWHTINSAGGYRCGNNTGLNGATDWSRYVYQSP